MSDETGAAAVTVTTTSTQLPAYALNSKGVLACTSCGISKELSESKLHRGWVRWHPDCCLRSENRPLHVFQAGSRLGCNVCSLIVDAVTSWRASHLPIDPALCIVCYIYLLDSGCKTIIEVGTSGDTWMKLEVFPEEDSKSPWNLLKQRSNSGDTSSVQASRTIKRILQVSEGRIWLCEGVNSLSEYACLSHCWGSTRTSLQLNVETVSALKNGLDLDQLPRTFCDAVVLCVSLGISYLWIDALCIFQDDLADWEKVAASMADIYANATITIAATWSHNSNQGCFSRTSADLKIRSLATTGLFVRTEKPPFPRYGRDTTGLWPLLKRAWVFQERRLSPRIIHLAKNQLYWECDSMFLSEDGSEDDVVKESWDFRSSMENPVNGWRNAVEHYSKLELTYEEDRLPAISAVVKQFQLLREDDVYIAGMWLNSLLSDLTWTAGIGSQLLPRRDVVSPSWSWLSASKGVYWSVVTIMFPTVRIVDTSYNITGPAHFGHASDASITIQGPSALVRVLESMQEQLEFVEISEQRLFSDSIFPIQWDFDPDTHDPPIQPGQTLSVLFVSQNSPRTDAWGTRIKGILLLGITCGQYERVGVMETYVNLYRDDTSRDTKEEEKEDRQRLMEESISSLPINASL